MYNVLENRKNDEVTTKRQFTATATDPHRNRIKFVNLLMASTVPLFLNHKNTILFSDTSPIQDYAIEGVLSFFRFVNATEFADRGGQSSSTENILTTETVYEDECQRGSFCDGDWGGPVVCKKGRSWVVAALAFSYFPQDGCVSGMKGSVDVQAYADWVESVIG